MSKYANNATDGDAPPVNAIIGRSPAMQEVYRITRKVARSNASVLLLGETGTGKELVASAIHHLSNRRAGPFVKVNCGALSESLLESELFGHVRGAFTGAVGNRTGRFEAAHTGTVFLDEIGDLSLPLQGKILRVLEEKVLERVGGAEEVRVDVRFVAATNKNLARMVEDKLFRQDLFYRLNVLTLSLPPLRDRKEDIAPLVADILARKGATAQVASEAMDLLLAHTWPGNVRELANVLERALVLSGGETVEPRHLPLGPGQEAAGEGVEELPPGRDIDGHLAEVEQRIILSALARSGGVQARAAEMLGIKPRSLWHRVKKYRIDASAARRDKF